MKTIKLLFIFIGLALILTSCTGNIKPTPSVISIPQTRYVPIPKELTEHCPIPEKTLGDRSPLEAKRVAEARKISLQNCNITLDQIAAKQGTLVVPDNKK